MKRFKKYAQAALFLVGVLLFWLVLRSINPADLKPLYPVLAGWSWLVFLFYPFMCAWDVQAWKVILENLEAKPAPYKELFWVRLVGEAVNNITPFLDIGGEPLKIILTHRRLGVSRKIAFKSCLTSRVLLLFSEVLFGVVGLLLGLVFLPLSSEWKVGFTLTGLTLTLGCVIFTVSFYSESKRKLLWATLYHFIGWVMGGVEMYFYFRLVGVPISLTQGILLESLLQIVRLLSFFIPGNLGAQEMGMSILAQILGSTHAIGVVVSVLKRIRQLVWTAIGFLIWSVFLLAQKKSPSVQP